MNRKLLFILILAFVVRFVFLGDVPSGVSHDELENINNGISLIKTGKDLSGGFLPLTVGGLGLVAIPAYVAGLGALIFGQSILGVRTLAVVLGTANVLSLYFIANGITKNQKAALFSAALYAVSPWGMHFSRMMFDPPVALFFALAALAILLNTKKTKYVNLGWLLLGLALISYYGFIFVVPVLALVLVWHRKAEIGKSGLSSGLTIMGISVLVLGIMIVSPGKDELSGQRKTELIFLQTERLSEKVIFERSQSSAPEALNKIFINKPIVTTREIMANYLSAFNPENIFSFGEASQILSPQNTGMLYLIELPLILVGAYQLFTKRKREAVFVFLIILIAPLTMAVSDERTYVARISLMFPLLLLLAGYGLFQIKSKAIKFGILGIYIFSISAFLYQYFFRYPIYAKEIWFDSERRVAEYLINNPEENTIVSTTEPRETFMEYAFYAKLTGEEMQKVYRVNEPIFVNNIMFRDCISLFEKLEELTLILDSSCRMDLSAANEFIRSREGASQIKWGIFKDTGF